FGEMRGVIGTVGRMHLEANDLAAVDVEDHVEIKPPSLDLCRQERHVPAPDFAGLSGDVRGWRPRLPWRMGTAPPVHLTMRAQHPMETRFTADIDTLIGQCRNDPRGWGVGEAGVGSPPRRSAPAPPRSGHAMTLAGQHPDA